MKRYTTTQIITSPIENTLRLAFIGHATAAGYEVADYSEFAADGVFDPRHGSLLIRTIEDDPDVDIYGHEGADHIDWLDVYANVKVESYRIDIIVKSTYGLVAIECDGHDWHDRTKQQAAYDRARDRWMLQNGIATIRFTGSEIHHSADKCASEAMDILRVESAVGFILAQSGCYRTGSALLRQSLEREQLQGVSWSSFGSSREECFGG